MKRGMSIGLGWWLSKGTWCLGRSHFPTTTITALWGCAARSLLFPALHSQRSFALSATCTLKHPVCKRCSVSYRRCGLFIQRRWVWQMWMWLLLQRCEDQAIAWSEFDVFSTEIVYASEICHTIPAFSLRKSSRETSTRIDWIKRLNTSRECSAFSRSNHLLTSRVESGTTLNPDVECMQWWFDWTRRWKKRYTCS